jgi:hypothetical protein
MADSLGDLLKRKNFDEPAEVSVIKTFLHENYKVDCQVTMQQRQIVIAVKGASLAGAIRVRLHELQALCQTDKRLVLRIVG